MFVTNLHGENKLYSKFFKVIQILSDTNVVIIEGNKSTEIQLNTDEKASGWFLCEPLFIHESVNREGEVETIIDIDYAPDDKILAIETVDNYYNKSYLSDEDEWYIDYNILSNTELAKYPKCPIRINDKVRVLKNCANAFGDFIVSGSIVTVVNVEMVDMNEDTKYLIRVKQATTGAIMRIEYEPKIFEMIEEIQKAKELEITGEPLEETMFNLDELLETDDINPDYYKQGKYETIDVIESIVNQNLSGFEGYLVGNIIKYVSRFKMKNGVKDLKKAKWYLEKLISENE